MNIQTTIKYYDRWYKFWNEMSYSCFCKFVSFFQVGVLSLRYPVVSFQEKSDTAYEKLLEIVQGLLKNDPSMSKDDKNKENEKTKNMSFLVS